MTKKFLLQCAERKLTLNFVSFFAAFALSDDARPAHTHLCELRQLAACRTASSTHVELLQKRTASGFAEFPAANYLRQKSGSVEVLSTGEALQDFNTHRQLDNAWADSPCRTFAQNSVALDDEPERTRQKMQFRTIILKRFSGNKLFW